MSNNETPYWQFRSMAERLAVMPCEGHEFGDDDPCADTGLCITEWCAPCAASAWVAETKKAEAPKGRATFAVQDRSAIVGGKAD